MITDTVVKYAAISAAAVLGVLSISLWYSTVQLELQLSEANETIATERSKYDSERSAASQAQAELQGKYRDLENTYVKTAAELEKNREENTAKTALVAAAVRARLRAEQALSRVSAASSVSGAAAVPAPAPYPPGSVGAVLGERAEPMVGVAERSDLLKEFLIECRALYEKVRGQ